MLDGFISVELFLLTLLNLMIFVKTESIIKTFISLFQMFPILLIYVFVKMKGNYPQMTTLYLSIFIFINLMLVVLVLNLSKKSLIIKKTDRNFRPDEYDD